MTGVPHRSMHDSIEDWVSTAALTLNVDEDVVWAITEAFEPGAKDAAVSDNGQVIREFIDDEFNNYDEDNPKVLIIDVNGNDKYNFTGGTHSILVSEEDGAGVIDWIVKQNPDVSLESADREHGEFSLFHSSMDVAVQTRFIAYVINETFDTRLDDIAGIIERPL